MHGFSLPGGTKGRAARRFLIPCRGGACPARRQRRLPITSSAAIPACCRNTWLLPCAAKLDMTPSHPAGKFFLFRRSVLSFILSLEGRRRNVRALNGLQPLKKAFPPSRCDFPQPAQPCRNGSPTNNAPCLRQGTALAVPLPTPIKRLRLLRASSLNSPPDGNTTSPTWPQPRPVPAWNKSAPLQHSSQRPRLTLRQFLPC